MCIATFSWTSGLASGLADITGLTDISDIIHSFDYDKSSSVSPLINGKSRNLQKLLNILIEQQLLCLMYYYHFVFFLLSFGVLAIVFIFYSKDLLVIVLWLFILLLLALSFSFSSSFTSSP